MSTSYLETPEGKLEYARYPATAPGGPTLVFLHEGLGCVALWKQFPERVARATGCDTLVYSRLGYGRSDPAPLPRPLDYMHHEGLDMLPVVLDRAGVERAILVGHSDGASIAIVNAGGIRDPRVEGLVLMAPHVFNEPVCVASIEAARDAYERGLREKLAIYHGANVDCAFRGWNDAWLDPGFLDWNIEEYLPRIRVPMLAIQGRDDEYGTLDQVRSIERKAGADVKTLILDDCAHSPHRDREQATLEAIAGFVESVAPNAAGAGAVRSA